jgi:hypothetical protein
LDGGVAVETVRTAAGLGFARVTRSLLRLALTTMAGSLEGGGVVCADAPALKITSAVNATHRNTFELPRHIPPPTMRRMV